MNWLHIDREEYDKLLDYDPRTLQSKIIDYIIWMKDEKKLSSSSIKTRIAALHHFYDMTEYEGNMILLGYEYRINHILDFSAI